MKFERALTLLSILLLGMAAVGRAAVPPPPVGAPLDGNREQVLEAYANLPLSFVENRGQTDKRVRYHAQGSHYAFYFTREEIVLSLGKGSDAPDPLRRSGPSSEARGATLGARGSDIRAAATAAVPAAPATHGVTLALRFLGGNPRVVVEGEERAPGEVNYLWGRDPARWHTKLPRYAQVVYRELWPGVDLMLRGRAGELKYEFRVRPGARHADIRLAYAGADSLALDGAGGLLIKTPLGVLRDSPPIAYQTIGGVRVAVESRYVLKAGDNAEGEYGFAVGADLLPKNST